MNKLFKKKNPCLAGNAKILSLSSCNVESQWEENLFEVLNSSLITEIHFETFCTGVTSGNNWKQFN